MLDRWLEDHKDEIIEVYVDLRRERGDPRTDEAIRQGVDVLLQTFARALQKDTAEWQQSVVEGMARQALDAGTPFSALAEAARVLYTAVQQVLLEVQPDELVTWLGALGHYMLLASEMATQVLAKQAVVQQITHQSLYKIGQEILTALDEDEVLQALMQPVMQTDVDTADLFYFDDYEGDEPVWMEKVAAWSRSGELLSPVGSRLYLPEFPFTHLFQQRSDSPLFIEDATTDPRMNDKVRSLVAQTGICAWVIVPLRQGGRWLGVLSFIWDSPNTWSAQEREFFHGLISLISPTVANRRLLAALEQRVAERTEALAAQTEALATQTEVLAAQNEEIRIFRTMIENAADAVILSTGDFHLTYVNPAGYELFGYDSAQEEMVGLRLSHIIVRRELRWLMGEVYPKVSQMGYWQGEVVLRRKDGTEFNALATYFTVEGQVEGDTYMASFLRDITAQKQAEQEQARLQQEVIDAQNRVIQELSTPVIPVMDEIIVMTLVGSIDSMRAKDIMRALLAGIRDYRARVVILDITGVPLVDSGVAAYLDKAVQAARLKGAHTIITGISDAVAETIVDLGIDWRNLQTLRDVHTGLAVALRLLGYSLGKNQ